MIKLKECLTFFTTNLIHFIITLNKLPWLKLPELKQYLAKPFLKLTG